MNGIFLPLPPPGADAWRRLMAAMLLLAIQDLRSPDPHLAAGARAYLLSDGPALCHYLHYDDQILEELLSE